MITFAIILMLKGSEIIASCEKNNAKIALSGYLHSAAFFNADYLLREEFLPAYT
jgi:hypothetical protein